mmetsp:Transcript_33042/g.91958  ORF Transcript_33042/g.91958 Transcript_33042/m.91958 type:complete len:124 (-) Transcript_33042:187-558(-)
MALPRIFGFPGPQNVFQRHPTDDAFMQAMRSGHPFAALKHLPEGTLSQLALHIVVTSLVCVVAIVLLVLLLRIIFGMLFSSSQRSPMVGPAESSPAPCTDATPTCVSSGSHELRQPQSLHRRG